MFWGEQVRVGRLCDQRHIKINWEQCLNKKNSWRCCFIFFSVFPCIWKKKTKIKPESTRQKFQFLSKTSFNVSYPTNSFHYWLFLHFGVICVLISPLMKEKISYHSHKCSEGLNSFLWMVLHLKQNNYHALHQQQAESLLLVYLSRNKNISYS